MTTRARCSAMRLGALLLGAAACSGAPEQVARVPARTAKPTAPPDARPTTLCSRADSAPAPALAAVSLRGSALAASCGALKSRAGSPVDEAAVDADVHELFATGLFDEVLVALEETDGATALVFELKDRPRVADVGVRGEPRGFDFREALGKKPAVYSPVWVRATDARLVEALHQDGYRKAKVDHEVTPAGDGTMAIRFAIEPGKRFVLGSVRFEGLSTAKADDLRKVLRLVSGQPAFDDLVERDVLFTQSALYDLGLIQSEVRSRVEENFLASTLDVVLTVHEGAVFKLGTVNVAGPAALPAAKYRAIVARLPRGSVFARSKVAAAIQEIEALHRAAGTERRVEVSTNVDSAKRMIDVELSVQ